MWYVDKNYHIPQPPKYPYYTDDFFESIQRAVQSGKEVASMTCKDWTIFLTSEIIMESVDQGNGVLRERLIPCRAEALAPNHNWEKTWSCARLKGLDSECITFLWRLIHQILPTRDRLFRLKMPNIDNSDCLNCHVEENTFHVFAQCKENRIAFEWLFEKLKMCTIDLTEESVFLLDFKLSKVLPYPH